MRRCTRQARPRGGESVIRLLCYSDCHVTQTTRASPCRPKLFDVAHGALTVVSMSLAYNIEVQCPAQCTEAYFSFIHSFAQSVQKQQ